MPEDPEQTPAADGAESPNPVPRVLWRTPAAQARDNEDRRVVPGKIVARGPVIKVAASDTKPAGGDKLVPGSVIRQGDVDPADANPASDPEAAAPATKPDEVGTEAQPEDSARNSEPEDSAANPGPQEPSPAADSENPAEVAEPVAPEKLAEPEEPEAADQQLAPGATGDSARLDGASREAEPEIPRQRTAPEAAGEPALPTAGQTAGISRPGLPAETARKAGPTQRDRDRQPGRHALSGLEETSAATGALAQAPTPADAHDAKWREIKAGFVDDPPTSVELAFGMVEWAVKDLAETVRQRRAASSGSDGAPDTEQLRQALLSYRDMFGELRRASERLAQSERPDPRG